MSQNEAQTLTCPSCYKITDCTPSQLPKHLKVEREVSASELEQSDERLCGSCDDNNKAEAYCQDCISPICSECVASHKRLKLLKSHTLVSLDTAKPQLPPISCPLHPKECFKYYCMTCSSLICADCIIEHMRHNFALIDEAASSEIRQLKKVLPKVKNCEPPVDDAIKEISGIIKIVDESKKASIEKLDKAFEEISAAIKRRHDQLSVELEDMAIAKTTRLEMQKEELEKITAGLKLAIDMATDACNEYTSIEVLAVNTSILRALKQVLDSLNPQSLKPVCTMDPEANIELLNIKNVIASLDRLKVLEGMTFYPPLCSLVGVDPKVAVGVATDCNCLLTLQTRNSRGEDLNKGGAVVKATVKIKSTEMTFNCKINDLQNGKYEILFTTAPSFFSNADIGELHITVDDTAVQDSPYAIKFIDYKQPLAHWLSVSTKNSPQYIDLVGNHSYISTNQGHIEIDEYDTTNLPFQLVNRRTISNSNLEGIIELRGIAVDHSNGVMFIASRRANEVIKIDLDGNVLATVGTGRELKFQYPTGLCLTKGGELLLVGDCVRKRVLLLKSDFSFVRSIKCRTQVWGVAVDPGDNIHVGTNECVEVFDFKGVKITEYGQQHLVSKAGDIQFPNFQQLPDCKYSFVTECHRKGEILFFNWKTDTVLQRIKTGSHPLGLRIDQSGRLSVCCLEDRKIQMLIW